jgi:hypothetical protein
VDRLLAVIYHVAAGQSYRELGADFHDRSQRRRVTRQMVERLEKLGYKVTLEEPPPQPGSEETATRLPPLPKKRGRPCKCAERGIPCPHAEKWAAKCVCRRTPHKRKPLIPLRIKSLVLRRRHTFSWAGRGEMGTEGSGVVFGEMLCC